MADRPYRDTYDYATLAVETLGFGAVIYTIVITLQSNAANDSDMRNALASMSAIAKSIKAEADAMSAERPFIERQASAAADSASAAKLTASLAKGQTSALGRQADALIRSAQATISAADAQNASAQANVRTAEAGARAAEEQRRSAMLFASTRAPASKLTSITMDGWLNSPDKLGNIEVSVKPSFTNTGGGTLFPGITTFHLIITDALKYPLPKVQDMTFGGNEQPISPNGSYSPNISFKYTISKHDAELVETNKKGILVWGKTFFLDGAGAPYTSCYLYVVQPPSKELSGGAVRPINLSGFTC